MYLGLDLSTQQLKGVLVASDLQILHETFIQFDNDLPEFRTSGGVVRDENNPKIIRAPTLIWVKALDMLLEKMRSNGVDFGQIKALSGCAQQHGTVYWAKGSREILQNLNPSKYLHEELSSCFSLTSSPTWMDSSTEKECALLESFVGGSMKMAQITGSRAFERFSGNQIMKIYREQKDAYFNTERICLVSNFLASLFIGDYAPIDLSDGSGMNLLDIHTKTWNKQLIQICAPGLAEKLMDPIPSQTAIGFVSKYLQQKYGFSQNCQVVAFTGDNPSSLVGIGSRKEDIICSLGTSDTLLLWQKEPTVLENGHVLINPLDDQSYMTMLCIKNGSLTRERIRNEYANKSWETFDELLKKTPAGNGGNLALYFDVQEIFFPLKGDFKFNPDGVRVDKFKLDEVEVRACIEGQFMMLKIQTEDFGYKIDSNTKIVVTGGASTNESILQILADVFQASVYISNTTNAAAVGGAYRAKLGSSKYNESTIKRRILDKLPDLKLCCQPQKDSGNVYIPLINRFRPILKDLTKGH